MSGDRQLIEWVVWFIGASRVYRCLPSLQMLGEISRAWNILGQFKPSFNTVMGFSG